MAGLTGSVRGTRSIDGALPARTKRLHLSGFSGHLFPQPHSRWWVFGATGSRDSTGIGLKLPRGSRQGPGQGTLEGWLAALRDDDMPVDKFADEPTRCEMS